MSLAKGSVYRAELTVYDEDGVLVNPSTCVVAVTEPDGTLVDPALTPVNDGTGLYHVDITGSIEGRWVGFWTTTGPATSHAFVFTVTEELTPAITSVFDAKRHLNLSLTSTVYDEELYEFTCVAAEIIESKVGSIAVRTVTDERHTGGGSLWLRHPPVLAVTAINLLSDGSSAYPVANVVTSYGGRVERSDGQPFETGPFLVTYQCGRPIVPHHLQHASKELISHLWDTQRGNTVVGQAAAPGESETFSVQGRAYTVPRRVLELLQPKRRGPLVR